MNVYFDTETTGLDDNAEIIQVGIIAENGDVLFDSLVKSEEPIPAEAQAIHGITNVDIADAPSWPEIHDDVCKILTSANFVYIYNADYDMRLLRQTASRYNSCIVPKINSVCLMKRYADAYNFGKWRKLIYACEDMNIDTRNIKQHSAIGDCELTRRLHDEMCIDFEKEVRARQKAREKREKLKQKKLEFLPANWKEFPDFGKRSQPGCETLSKIPLRDMHKYEFVGTCCNAYGGEGFLFKPKKNNAT